MLMRGPIKQEGIKITNIYAANIRTVDVVKYSWTYI